MNRKEYPEKRPYLHKDIGSNYKRKYKSEIGSRRHSYRRDLISLPSLQGMEGYRPSIHLQGGVNKSGNRDKLIISQRPVVVCTDKGGGAKYLAKARLHEMECILIVRSGRGADTEKHKL
jgi:hypothetical protein